MPLTPERYVPICSEWREGRYRPCRVICASSSHLHRLGHLSALPQRVEPAAVEVTVHGFLRLGLR
jgi:hypothetical protein